MPLRHLASLVAPPRCALCSVPCGVRETVCVQCDERLTRLRPRTTVVSGLDLAWSATDYEGIGRRLVHALKFDARLALAQTAAATIASAAPTELLAGSVVPVPASPWRRRRRGFDAAGAIARELARETTLPLARCLRRADGPRQVGRTRAERIAHPLRVRLTGDAPAEVVLVDDVLTTGATLWACASTLRDGGAGRVVAVTFARS